MLEVDDLHAHYGRAHILHGVSLALGRGEAAALMGRNGAGKSTTLKCIAGLVPVTSGHIRFGAHDVTGWRPYVIVRLGLGYVPEDRRIFAELTVLENLEVGRQPPRDGVPHWTPERLFALFPNLAEIRHREAGRTSGGEQQMLTIARTLMGNPRAVLLDEPSEGLAPLVVGQMAEAIRELKRDGLTVLLAEQSLHFARAVADRALIIEQGRIRHAGPMRELVENEALRREYLTV